MEEDVPTHPSAPSGGLPEGSPLLEGFDCEEVRGDGEQVEDLPRVPGVAQEEEAWGHVVLDGVLQGSVGGVCELPSELGALGLELVSFFA